MKYKRYDIVVVPPKNITEQAIAMSQSLATLDSFFVLDGETLHPHISLYHVPFEEQALETALERIGNITATTDPFLLEQEIYYPDQGVWVGVRYVAGKAILDLHTTVIEAMKGLRVVEDDARYMARWAELGEQQRKNIQNCGWSNAFTSYSPHLSFTKLKQPMADIFAQLPQPDLSFLVERLGLYELGEHGTCRRLIADFRIGNGVTGAKTQSRV